MWKFVGIVFIFCGVAGVLHNWICEQREIQNRLENMVLFLQKSLYVMRTEKIKVVDYFERYIQQNKTQGGKKDIELEYILDQIKNRLSTNTYPNGQMVWEEVFMEDKQRLHFDRDVFSIIVQAGNGFFGKSREENISFLERSIRQLEQQQEKLKERQTQERKVWIPIGMLGSVMLVILFV